MVRYEFEEEKKQQIKQHHEESLKLQSHCQRQIAENNQKFQSKIDQLTSVHKKIFTKYLVLLNLDITYTI